MPPTWGLLTLYKPTLAFKPLHQSRRFSQVDEACALLKDGAGDSAAPNQAASHSCSTKLPGCPVVLPVSGSHVFMSVAALSTPIGLLFDLLGLAVFLAVQVLEQHDWCPAVIPNSIVGATGGRGRSTCMSFAVDAAAARALVACGCNNLIQGLTRSNAADTLKQLGALGALHSTRAVPSWPSSAVSDEGCGAMADAGSGPAVEGGADFSLY